MCKTCSGIGKILDLDIERAIDRDKSWNESMLNLPAFGVGNYYWKQYAGSGLFDLDKRIPGLYTGRTESSPVWQQGTRGPPGE